MAEEPDYLLDAVSRSGHLSFNDPLDVYRLDQQAGRSVLVSRTPTGRRGNGPSIATDLSVDGATAVFESLATNLTAKSGPSQRPRDNQVRRDRGRHHHRRLAARHRAAPTAEYGKPPRQQRRALRATHEMLVEG